MSVRVLKFGGTSLGSPEAMRAAGARIGEAAAEGRVVVVASALAGVTNRLQAAVEQAIERAPAASSTVDELRRRHFAQLAALAPAVPAALGEALARRLERLAELLAGIALLRDCPPAVRAEVLATGERLAVVVLAAALAARGVQARVIDAAEIVRTDSRFDEAAVDWAQTRRLARRRLGDLAGEVAVVPGFFGGDTDGRPTLLGRGASDWSATLLGAALAAERVEIWTDVDGVLSADPRLVAGAFLLPELAFREAAELAFFGARVLHPGAIEPAERAAVPVWIRNTLRPASAGTWITAEPARCDGARGVVTCDVGLLEFPGGPGLAARVFAECDRARLHVLLVQQATARGDLSLVLPAMRLAAARRVFADVGLAPAGFDLSLLAAVGVAADGEGGWAVRDALAEAAVRPHLIAERLAAGSVVALVERDGLARAASAVHERLVRAGRHAWQAGGAGSV